MSEPMSSDVFPLPGLTPLTQLNVQDNLRINAERWQLAHHYHQHRQNVHYQALWQPGIVYGLGVKLTAPPAGTAPQFQTKSWIEVQPGFAIDGEGNPIVISEERDRTYPVTIPPLTDRSIQTLYLVVNHVDPRQLELPNSTDRLQEQFRFDQRINHLRPKDIELCRIRISADQDSLAMPPQGLTPELGQLDLTQRRFAQLRSQRSFTLGLFPNQQRYQSGLTALFQGMQVLYPGLHGQLQTVTQADAALDALCVSGTSLIEWQQSNTPGHTRLFQSLKDYPGGLLIVAEGVDRLLQESIKRLQRHLELRRVASPHLITRHPFLFGQLPELSADNGLWVDDRIVIVPPSLFEYWHSQEQSRQAIRTWHEFGINLLYYIWYNSHIRKLLR